MNAGTRPKYNSTIQYVIDNIGNTSMSAVTVDVKMWLIFGYYWSIGVTKKNITHNGYESFKAAIGDTIICF